MALCCNQARILKRLEALAACNDTPGSGITRFSYGAADQRARDYLSGEMHTLGMKVTVDSAGNMRGRYAGQDDILAPVWAGSHLDTVLHGGRFDGAVGIVGALEAVQVFAEQGIRPLRPIEVVAFAEEEGSNFFSTMTGSKYMTGLYTPEDFTRLRTAGGIPMQELLSRSGIPTQEDPPLQSGDIHAMLELHVEQGGVLENLGIPVAIVGGIFGSRTLQITLRGDANHAGSTPMHLRRDPLIAAAQAILEMNRIACAQTGAVATTGRLSCKPGITNCIPGEVTFSADIRAIERCAIDTICTGLEASLQRLQTEMGVRFHVEKLAQSDPVQFGLDMVALLEDAAVRAGAPYTRMDSGAVHDAAILSRITKAGMIFVPSAGGKSHVPEEYTRTEDIETGCNVLIAALLRLAEEGGR